jgi:predicted N-acetyltransferase YhbS
LAFYFRLGTQMNLTIRPAVIADAEDCGRIIYKAFMVIADSYGVLPHFPTLEAAIERARFCLSHPAIYGVVAEINNKIIGSNFLDERDSIYGLGPLTVEPNVQMEGIERRLMETVLNRSIGAIGVRLVKDSFNMLSVSLYGSLGFEVKEPLLLMQGRPMSKPSVRAQVRRLTSNDLKECAALCENVHGFSRINELRDALKMFSPMVGVREGRITSYTVTPTIWPLNHAVAETEEDLEALVLGVAAVDSAPMSWLLPVRKASLFRWFLREGFRSVLPMTLMVVGRYQEPDGAYFPSILY